MPESIKKRDGRLVPYDEAKIASAIDRAFVAAESGKGEDEAEDSGDYNNGNSPYDCIVQYKFEGRTSENFGKVIKSAEALDKAGLTYLTHRSTENFEDRK